MAWTEQRGKRFRGMYRTPDGKVRSAGWSTNKKEAKALATVAEATARLGDWSDPDAGRISLAQYFDEHWLPNRRGEIFTLVHYESNFNSSIREPLGAMEIRNITPAHIQRWVLDLERHGYKASTVRAKYTTLASILGARKGVSAVFDGLIPTTPCRGIQMPAAEHREVTVYDVAELDALLAALPEWWRPMVMLASESGLRWGEILGLRASSVMGGDLFVGETVVQSAKRHTGTGTQFAIKAYPKNRKPRRVALSEFVSTAVVTEIKARQLFPGDRLFPRQDPATGLSLRTTAFPDGHPPARDVWTREVWAPAHKQAGIEQRRFHDLRGSHISWLLAGGADVATVQARVGHNSLATTQRYVAALGDTDKRALDALAITQARARTTS